MGPPASPAGIGLNGISLIPIGYLIWRFIKRGECALFNSEIKKKRRSSIDLDIQLSKVFSLVKGLKGSFGLPICQCRVSTHFLQNSKICFSLCRGGGGGYERGRMLLILTLTFRLKNFTQNDENSSKMRWLDGINYLEVLGLNANKIHAVFHAKNKTYKESYIKGTINGCEHVFLVYIVIQNKKSSQILKQNFVRSHTNFGPDRFSRFDVYWIQTIRQTS